MGASEPVSMLVIYKIKEGTEDRFLPLLQAHWPTLDRLGLVTDEPVRLWKAFDKRLDSVRFVETFQWKTAESSSIAHQTPEVMKVWEPMGEFLEGLDLYRIEPLPT
jgi:hypothetical protein